MISIAANSIELGPIPFNLYAPERGRLILFCRSGFPITERHQKLLKSSARVFYVGNDEMDSYLDYAFERLERIIGHPDIQVSDKSKIVHGVGKRTVKRLMEDPRSGEVITHSKKVVESYIELVLQSKEAAGHLLALSSTDSYTFSHSINVCTFCLLIGEKLFGQGREALWELGMSGLMHDIGKTMVDQDVLFKPARLNEEEMQEVRKHAEYSFQLIKEHKMPESVQASGLSHHERLDGSGYPQGLENDYIHDYAKITAVADIYDAITSNRVYRKGKPHLQALEEMTSMKGQIDAGAFEALLKIVLRNQGLIDKFVKKEIHMQAVRYSVAESGEVTAASEEG